MNARTLKMQALIELDKRLRETSDSRGDTQKAGANPELLNMSQKDAEVIVYGVSDGEFR